MPTPDDFSPASPAAPPAARRRWLGTVLTVLVMVALAGAAYWLVQRSKAPQGVPGAGARGGFRGPGGPGGGSGGVTVGLARATAGEIPVIVDALGTVTPPITAALVPQVSGVLTEVLFTEGQRVHKGQVLARIDARTYEQVLAQTKAQTAKDVAQLAAARVTLERYQTLLAQDSIARQSVDTQAALVRQLEAAVQADRASQQAAQLNVDFTSIRAPVTGVIGLRTVDPGNLVSSGTSAGIATIAQVDPIDVVFSVPQDRIPAVLAAQRAGALPVTALDRARTQTLAEGTFLTLDNQITTSTGTVRAKARFANPGGQLFPNQFVNARLRLGFDRGVLVPVTAVRTGPQGDYVYVVDDERVAHMRAVTRGIATPDQVLISQGLQAGEQVITEGGDRVKDGGRVQLAAGAPAGAASGAGTSGRGQSASAPPAAAGVRNSDSNPPPAGAPQAQPAIQSGATSAAAPQSGASRADALDRLPPELREKVMAMAPDERRAYLQKLREAPAARERQPAQ